MTGKELMLIAEGLELRKQINRIMKPTEITIYPEVWQVRVKNTRGEIFHSEQAARAFAETLTRAGYPIEVRVASDNQPPSEWMDVDVIWGI